MDDVTPGNQCKKDGEQQERKAATVRRQHLSGALADVWVCIPGAILIRK